jgi:hypothetical protein
MGDRQALWRQRAVELREMAATARDPMSRQLLLQLAQEYDDLMERSLREEKRDPSPA